MPPQQLQAGEDIAVIIHRDAAQTTITQEKVKRIFLRKKLFWEDGKRVIPVNLPVDHALRQNFSRTILGKSPEDLNEYWNCQYFHGISPPYVLASEAAVLQFVATTPGAIGYIGDSKITGQVRVLFIFSSSTNEAEP